MARFRPHLARYNVTEPQWRIIRAVAGENETDATELSRRCCILMPSLSRILKTLERDGIISRKRTAGDGRRQIVKLTAKGSRLFAKMAPESEKIYAAIEADFGVEDTAKLVETMKSLRSKLG